MDTIATYSLTKEGYVLLFASACQSGVFYLTAPVWLSSDWFSHNLLN